MHKIDLHVHSQASNDASLTVAAIGAMLESGRLDTVAITDHNTITGALKIKQLFGDKIIVGEEIKTSDGEIIGLYLNTAIEPGLSASQTIQAIKQQNGLVYIPHPFDSRRRSGLTLATLETIASDVDIIETCNGRDYSKKHAERATIWAWQNKVAQAHSSDAHGPRGWGKTYSVIERAPSRGTLVQLLNEAEYCSQRVGLIGLAYPSLNRLLRKRRG